MEEVLSKAPGIIEELRAYQGAGEAIREVSESIYSIFHIHHYQLLYSMDRQYQNHKAQNIKIECGNWCVL